MYLPKVTVGFWVKVQSLFWPDHPSLTDSLFLFAWLPPCCCHEIYGHQRQRHVWPLWLFFWWEQPDLAEPGCATKNPLQVQVCSGPLYIRSGLYGPGSAPAPLCGYKVSLSGNKNTTQSENRIIKITFHFLQLILHKRNLSRPMNLQSFVLSTYIHNIHGDVRVGWRRCGSRRDKHP